MPQPGHGIFVTRWNRHSDGSPAMVAPRGAGIASANASSQGATPMRRSHAIATLPHPEPFADAKCDVPNLVVVTGISCREYFY
jgi:hypothetical protein